MASIRYYTANGSVYGAGVLSGAAVAYRSYINANTLPASTYLRVRFPNNSYYQSATTFTNSPSGEQTLSLPFSSGGVSFSSYEVPAYTLTLNAGTGGSVSGNGTFEQNTTVTITATPAANYKFVQWSDGNTSASRSVTVSADMTLTAQFAQDKFRLYAASENTARGTVSLTGWSSGSYFAPGTVKEATAAAKAGWAFTGWYRTGQSTPDYTTATASLLAYSQDTTYTARFASTRHTVNVSKAGEGSNGYDVELFLYVNNALAPSLSAEVEDGDTVMVKTLETWAKFSGWSVTGRSPAAGQTEYQFTAGGQDAAVINCVANWLPTPTCLLRLNAVNGWMGAVSLKVKYRGGWVDAGLNSSMYTIGYSGKVYRIEASAYNARLHTVAGITVEGNGFPAQGAAEFLLREGSGPSDECVAVVTFAENPSCTLAARASDGGAYSPGNPAEQAGCSVAVADPPDFTSPDRYVAGNVTVGATPGTGWRVIGYSVHNASGGTGGYSVNGNGTEIVLALSFDTVLTVVFGKIPSVASVKAGAEAAALGCGASVKAGLASGAGVPAAYGDALVFTATGMVPGKVAFTGWHGADGTLVSAANPYSTTAGLEDLTLEAVFSARVDVAADNILSSDGSGTAAVGAAGETPSAASAWIRLGCEARAVAQDGAGAVFRGWSGDGGVSFITGFGADEVFTVTKPVTLTAVFVGAADVAVRWLAVVNWDNNAGAEDDGLGVISVEGDGVEEVSRADWDLVFVPHGLLPPPETPGSRFYKFTGTRKATVKAAASGGLGFMRWRLRTKADASPAGAWGGETVLGTQPQVAYTSVSHGMLYADWGVPVEVDVALRYADGCGAEEGGFSMSPETAKRKAVTGGFSDSYVQGAVVRLEAWAANGYRFGGWCRNGDGSVVISAAAVLEVKVEAAVLFFALFVQDTEAVYRWDGGDRNKTLTWRSKRFAAAMPVNMSCAEVQAAGYPVTLRVYAASSPDDPGGRKVAQVAVCGPQGMRLPMARPEKYVEVEVSAAVAVTEVAVATSMGGLRGGG